MSNVESVKASVTCHVITVSVNRPCSILNFILVYIVYDGFERFGVDFVAFLLFGSCTFRYATNFFLHMLVMMRKHFESLEYGHSLAQSTLESNTPFINHKLSLLLFSFSGLLTWV